MAKTTEPPESTRSPYVAWAQYADGAWWELERGQDFTQGAAQATRAARQWASVNGYRCNAHTVRDGEAIKVRFEKVVISQ